MCNVLSSRWIITPLIAPRPWIACSGCGHPRPFQSSGKIRLNANGRKLDAWLIYRCLVCDRTWNRSLVERRNIGDIDPAILEALHFSDPDWVRAREFDLTDLSRHTLRIEEFVEVHIRKESLGETAAGVVLIELSVALPTCLRLDRLLSAELGYSRSRLLGLHEQGKMRIDPVRKDAMRRRVRDGTRIFLDR